jgi:SNF2 family DNA or RNA helicase
MWLLDRGAALGQAIGDFRRRWYDPPSYMAGKYELKLGAEKQIHDALGNRCLTLRAEDYLDLPPVMDNYIPVEMSLKQMAQYKEFKRDFVTEIEDKTVTAVNAGVLAGKLLQCANGAVYTDYPRWDAFHDKKVEALSDIVDTTEGPRLIFYNFKSDLERIEARLRADKKPYRVLKSEQDEKDWDDGLIENLLLHPASAGHGLNMHKSGSDVIIWFGLNWSLELTQQANARLTGGHRRAGRNVVIHYIYTQGTIDEAVIASLDDKDATQERLLYAMRVLIRSE